MTLNTGSPCGLAMGSSCVWYVMVTAALNYTVSWMDESSNTLHRVKGCLKGSGSQAHASISFQSLGTLVAEAFKHTPGIYVVSLNVYLKTNVFLFLWGPAFTFYLLLRLLGIALLWSVSITKKCCANSDWIHIDSMPFAGLVRNLRVLFGLGFSINSEMFLLSCQGKNGAKLSLHLLCALTSLTTMQLYCFIKIPTHMEPLFYLLSFCKSTSIPLTVVALIPYCVHMLMRPSERRIK
nr:LOW QUALITY PROTEIN: glucose-6-phosphatase 2 [Rattus norvegicus]|eukprot:XP_017447807.1 PREDICTED: LOW QUALITY PROTEIN: glucose-6-phosphatase 2 [Rattus norvegicus]